MGLLDASGNVAVTVPGYNNTVYTLTNFARRFTPNCPTCNTVLNTGFASIKATHLSGANKVEWQSNYEHDAASFLVERSSNGSDFQTIGLVNGLGSNPQGHSYTYMDENPYLPLSYYRITYRDQNGAESTSEVIMVSSTGQGVGITGLSTDEQGLTLNLFSESSSAEVKIEIVDLAGRVVLQRDIAVSNGSTERFIPLSGHSEGTYLVRLSGDQGRSSVRKFMWR